MCGGVRAGGGLGGRGRGGMWGYGDMGMWWGWGWGFSGVEMSLVMHQERLTVHRQSFLMHRLSSLRHHLSLTVHREPLLVHRLSLKARLESRTARLERLKTRLEPRKARLVSLTARRERHFCALSSPYGRYFGPKPVIMDLLSPLPTDPTPSSHCANDARSWTFATCRDERRDPPRRSRNGQESDPSRNPRTSMSRARPPRDAALLPGCSWARRTLAEPGSAHP